MEKEVEYVTLNNIDYIIIDVIKVDDTEYYYLSNENDEKDFHIRKSVTENGEEFLDIVEGEEYNKAMEVFSKKYLDSSN